MIFTVLLTGGIASGKTTVEKIFHRLGVPCVDTDLIARQLTNPTFPEALPILAEILQKFGTEVFSDIEAQLLDRAQLRRLIFNQPDKKKCLESILHPAIFEQVNIQLAKMTEGYAILSVPLFHRASRYRALANRVLCVNVPYGLQIERLMQRDQIDRGLATQIIAAQPSTQERLSLADDILENIHDIYYLTTTVYQLHVQYQHLVKQFKR